METVHYLILGGAAALTAAILFPGFGAKAKAVVQAAAPTSAPGGTLRSAIQTINDEADTLAYADIQEALAKSRAVRVKAEIQELFAFDQTAATPKAKS